jgi:predicted HicB family RNase H-like nuclease
MKYQGYSAKIEYSEDDNCFVGHLLGIQDIVGFHGQSVDELRLAFEEAVKDYIETCKKLNKEPLRPFSGQFMVRVPPALHAQASILAGAKGQSLNQFVLEALTQQVGQFGQRLG